jgi:hypothetical protein
MMSDFLTRRDGGLVSEGALILDGLDDALVGVSDCGRLIYDYNKTVKIFMNRDGMTTEEAIEWIDYNVMGVQCNGKGFIMMYDRSLLEIEEVSS